MIIAKGKDIVQPTNTIHIVVTKVIVGRKSLAIGIRVRVPSWASLG
jgi:hypothetical protein